MSTYYFNVRCEQFQRTDLVGEECDSLADIRSEALRTARELGSGPINRIPKAALV